MNRGFLLGLALIIAGAILTAAGLITLALSGFIEEGLFLFTAFFGAIIFVTGTVCVCTRQK